MKKNSLIIIALCFIFSPIIAQYSAGTITGPVTAYSGRPFSVTWSTPPDNISGISQYYSGQYGGCMWMRYIGSGNYSEIYRQNYSNPFTVIPSTPITTNFNMRCRVNWTNGSYDFTNEILVIELAAFNPGTISASSNPVCYNYPVTLSFSTNPSGGNYSYTYQWQYSTNNSTWNTITGATSSTYTTGNLTGNRYYRCLVNAGAGAIETNYVYVTVRNPVTAGTIGSTETICYNSKPSAMSFTAAPEGGTGSNYTYQWQVSTNNSTWSGITGADSTIYAPGTLTSNRYYRCAVTNGSCGTFYTNTVTKNVQTLLAPGTVGANGPSTICYNANAPQISFTTNASGSTGSFSYMWQVSENNTDWNNIANATTTAYSPGNLTNMRYYRCTVSDACTTRASNSVAITVRPQVTGGQIGDAQSICHNSSPTTLINVTNPAGGDGTNYSYQWQVSTDNSEWDNINSAQSQALSPGTLTSDTYYRRSVTSAGCGPAFSNTVYIDVRNPYSPGSIMSNQTICTNSVPEKIGFFEAPSAEGAISYQWYESENNASYSPIAGAIGAGYQPAALASSKYYRCSIGTNCGNLNTNSIFISVPESVSPGTIGSDQTICYNSSHDSLKSITPATKGVLPYNYKWQCSTDNENWVDLADGGNADYGSYKLTSKTYFRRLVTDNCATTETSNVATVNVRDRLRTPVTDLKNMYCLNSKVEVNVLNPYPQNNWYNKEMELIKNDTVFSIGELNETILLYLQFVNDYGCKSEALPINITVDPVKANFLVLDQVIAEGGIARFQSTSTGASEYLWIFGNGLSGTGPTPSTVYNIPGVYDVSLIVTSAEGCQDSYTLPSAINVSNLTNINTPGEETILIYPQPVSGFLNINIMHAPGAKALIYNSAGIIMQEVLLNSLNNHINLSGFNAGVYILKIIVENGNIYTHTILKK
ncbi:MAG: T9SS type A sorting domain-containing protein [Bacteroidales bacterium]|nr:T9SS type A sorting domain-containing protein [Bacteroidales bacterium]